ncbi:MAG TPA: ABC transporter substrate-binding protein [Azospirillum sp.]|nr:ABC transporter substrate-binding protein [Azospirillum sp.]
MKRTVIAGLAGLALLAAAPAAAQETPRRGGTYTFAVYLGEPDTYDCHATNSIASLYRLAPHYSLLLKYDPANYPKIVGDVAESWSASEDGKTYRFTIRSGVTFHDGSPLTSADVKATYERLRKPPEGIVSLRTNHFRDIEGIDTPDDRTVVFRLAQPNASMPAVFAGPFNCIYSAKKLAEDPRFPARNILGTGPFRFVKHEAGAEWQAVRFENYFDKRRPHLDGLRILNMAPPAAVNALSAGQIQAAFPGQSQAEITRISAARGDKVKVYDPVTTQVMFLATVNAAKPPFNDVRVRQALSLAIDRRGGSQALSKMMTASAFGTFIHEGSPFARTPDEVRTLFGFRPDMAANRAEAKRLLAEAGVPNLKLVFLNRPQYAGLGVFLIDQWRQIGVAATQELPENQRFFETQRAGAYDVSLDALAEYTDDPTMQLARLISRSKNPSNVSRADDPAFDELFEKQMHTIDPAERKALVQRLEEHLLTQSISMPLFWSKRYIVMSAEVRGATTPVVASNYVGLDQSTVWLAH